MVVVGGGASWRPKCITAQNKQVKLGFRPLELGVAIIIIKKKKKKKLHKFGDPPAPWIVD